MLRKRYPVLFLASIIATLLYGGLLISVSGSDILHGRNDFAPLWAGAKLIGTPGLYSFEANREAERRATGVTMRISYFRPPFYAALLKPLMLSPYLVAYWIFQLAALASLLWFLRTWCRWENSRWRYPEVLVWCGIPIVDAFANGQDIAFVLALAGLSLTYARQGKDVKSGLALALCAIKFHLFLLVPVAVAVRRRWGILAGAVFGLGALAAISFLVQGLTWPLDYWRILHAPGMNPSGFLCISLRGLAGDNPAMLAVTCVLTLALFSWIAAREPSYEVLFGFAVLAGLLLSYHAYAHDALLLMIPMAILLQRRETSATASAVAIGASSVPYAGLYVPGPWHVIAPLSLFAALSVAAMERTKFRTRASEALPTPLPTQS
jgi:hypothetical protein